MCIEHNNIHFSPSLRPSRPPAPLPFSFLCPSHAGAPSHSQGHRHSTIHNRGGNEPQPSIGTGRRCVGNAGHGYCCGRSIDDRDKGNDDDDSVGENYVEQHQQQQSRSNEAELLRRQARIFVEAGDTESGEMLLDKVLFYACTFYTAAMIYVCIVYQQINNMILQGTTTIRYSSKANLTGETKK